MRSRIAGMPIRWKLASVTVVTTIVALIATGLTLAIYDTRTYERQRIASIAGTTNILADSVAAALMFNDPTTVSEYLHVFAANPDTVAAAVYGPDRELIARYQRQGMTQVAVPETSPGIASRFEGGFVSASVSVIRDGRSLGTVYVRERAESVATRLLRFGVILLIAVAASLAVILPIALRLHRAISNPLEQLADKNAIIETTLASVDHGVLVVDGSMLVSYLNERGSEILAGFGLGDLDIGHNIEDAIRQSGKAAMRRDLELMASQEPLRLNQQLPDGRTIELRQSPLPQGGFVRTYTDITEGIHREAELQAAMLKAEAADRAKSQFLAAMSHEIRTPMNGVIGIVELLHGTALSPEQQQMVEIIRQSGLSLLDVINDILDYSKIEAGKMTIETTRFALGDVIETAAVAIGGHTKSKTLNIRCGIDPAIDWVVEGDPVRIRQVVLNLMGNALKFTEMGTIAVDATAESTTGDSVTVLFEVSDTGIGIEPEKLRTLFQPFSQADYSTTRVFGGTGLGLSICKNLVELMGGDIGCRSAPGEGSVFWFRVTFGRLPESERKDPFVRYAETLAGLRVIVFDRSEANPATARYLKAADVQVTNCRTVAELLDGLSRAQAAGQPLDLAVIRVGVSEDSGSLITAELTRRRDIKDTKTLFVVPRIGSLAHQLSGADASAAVVVSPLQRDRFYDAVAEATGREPAHDGARAAVAALEFTAPGIEQAAAHGGLILVAEDNETNRFVIESQLARLGYAAEFVYDGREGWNVYCRDDSRYSLLITDCHMPFTDGYQLTGMIRDREMSTGRRLPIVALTANALKDEADTCLAAGMDDYMSKPVELKHLDEMVRRWMPKGAELRRPAGAAPPAVPAAAPSAPAPIDMEVLARILGKDDPNYLRLMLDVFWQSVEDSPAKLHQLAEVRDARQLKSAAHSARGAAASAGANILAELLGILEAAADGQEWRIVDDLLPGVQSAFDDLGAFIEATRATAG
ncbi:ATP-binding protein [Emcibacter sp. SYSU 3D8]|uniref:hybrid sensor histidine kinase/response regulator n=1 Tax=Emcibacter sp. SYSU 3D8 TaxID=3133969 RepID=UPI0031FF074F